MSSVNKTKSKSQNFSKLAKRLEARVIDIETQLKENIDLLESDIQKAIKKSGLKGQEKSIQNELTNLGALLESRIQKTLTILSENEEGSKNDKDHLEIVKKLSKQLTKVLSFDFYGNVVHRLGNYHQGEEVDAFGMDKRFISRIRPLFDYLYFRYWRVSTIGIENIPAKGSGLIVGNHSGTVPYDGSMIKTAIMNEHPSRDDARFLVEDFVFHMPMLGSLMYRIGGVRACPENAEHLLEAGHLVVVFPEGVKGIGKYYRDRYKLQRMGRGGFIRLCMKTRSPLIPVAIVGAEEIHPILFKSNVLAKTIGIPYLPITPTFPVMGLLGMLPLPSKWSIQFGKPMSFERYGKNAIDDDLLIHKLSEKVRGEIQEMIFNQLRGRRSVWFG